MQVTSIRQSKEKVYWVKRYSNGTYYLNQSINGKQFYKTWTQTSARYAKSLTRRMNGEREKYITLAEAKPYKG